MAQNARYKEILKVFNAHRGETSKRRLRTGECPACHEQALEAIEKRNDAAFRVDGECGACGAAYNRAGLAPADGWGE